MKNFSVNKFSKLIYFLLPVAIIAGNFYINFVIIYSLLFAFYLFFNNENFKIIINREIIYLTFFFIYLVINIFINNDQYSVESTIKYLRFYFFCLCIFYLLKNDDKFYKNLTFIFFIVLSIILFDGFYQYFVGENLLGFKKVVAHRISSVFGDELIMGSFISKYSPLAILFLLSKKKYSYLIIPILFFFLILSFVSGERTAFVITMFIYLFTILKLYGFQKLSFFISIIILIIFLIINFDGVVKNRMIDNTLESTKFITEWKNPKSFKIYTDQHNAHFQSAYLMYKKGNYIEKLFGRGVKSFRKNCSKKEFCDATHCCSTHPHNLFLQVLSEIGLIGLFFYLYLTLYLIFNAMILFLKNSENERFILLISILFNYLPFLTSGNIFGTFLSTNFFLLLSFLLYLNTKMDMQKVNLK